MNPKLFFKQIILPLLFSGSMAYLLSIIEYYGVFILSIYSVFTAYFSLKELFNYPFNASN